jgi:hypothetical protein
MPTPTRALAVLLRSSMPLGHAKPGREASPSSVARSPLRRSSSVYLIGLFLDVALVCGLATPAAVPTAAALPRPTAETRAISSTTGVPVSLPVVFEPNVGQFDEPALFRARAGRTALHLARTEATLVNGQTRVELSWPGAAAEPRLVGEGETDGRANYFLSDDPTRWRTDVPLYAAVRYEALYDGIDLVFHDAGGSLEYDFLVAPGANPNLVRVRVSGATDVAVDEEGALVISTPEGRVLQRRPDIYQQGPGGRQRVEGSFRLADDREYGFDVGPYDPRLPLVIDPVVTFSTYLGGRSDDIGYALTVDAAGCAYVAGSTYSSDFPVVGPVDTDDPDWRTDVFVTKLDAAGARIVYSTYVSGNTVDDAAGIAVDGKGCAYVTGNTGSPDFPTVGSPRQFAGVRDAFVLKLSPEGSALEFSTFLGGNYIDYGNAVSVAASGNVYLTGSTGSPDFPTTAGAQADQPEVDAFLAILDASGAQLLFSTYLGGDLGDYGYAVATDPAGGVYVAGRTDSANFPTVSAFQADPGDGMADGFVAKYDPNSGRIVFSTYFGGSGWDTINGVAADVLGTIHVAGATSSPNLPTRNAIQVDPNRRFADSDAFVARFDPMGSNLLYSTYLGGGLDDVALSLAVDAAGSAYLTGYTDSTDFPTVAPVQTDPGDGRADAFVAKVSPSGAHLQFSTYLGGNFDDSGWFVATDGSGNAYVTGNTYSVDFPTQNPLQRARAGLSYDAFVTKLAPSSAEGLVVNTTGDPGDGTQEDGKLTLREAIAAANESFGEDLILFDIPGPGQHTIHLGGPLPPVLGATTIDGYSQPGALDAPTVEIRGDGTQVSGLVLAGAPSVVRGLAMNEFGGAGIVLAGAGGHTVEGCYVGLGLDGATPRGNGGAGILITSSDNLVGGIGDLGPLPRNVISGNGGAGVHVASGSKNRICGNVIGVGAIDSSPIPNAGDGVCVVAPGNVVGGVVKGSGNRIVFNGSAGVSASSGTAILLNSIVANGGLGIEARRPYASPEDDEGSVQGAPVIVSAVARRGYGVVEGWIQGEPLSTIRIEIFHSSEADPSGYGEGDSLLRVINVTMDGAGRAAFRVVTYEELPTGFVSATATNASGSTSEFGAWVRVR